MKQEASFSPDVSLILPWSERHDAFLPAQLSQTFSAGSCLQLQLWWSSLVRYTLKLFCQVHTGALWSGTHWNYCPVSPLPLTAALADEQSPSEPVQEADLVDS